MPEKPGEPDMDDLIRLSVFSAIGTSIVGERTIHGVLDRVMEHLGTFFGPLNWSVLLVDSSKDELVFARVVGRGAETLTGKRMAIGEGVSGWVAQHGVSAIVENPADDPRWSNSMDILTGFKTESIIAVPLRSGERVFGVIELLNRLNGERFSAYDMRVLSTIADFAAIGVEKAYYLAEARRVSERDPLTNALNRRGLARAIDREKARRTRYGGDLSVVLADIDRFKAINDGFGHAAGDDVLKAVAKALAGAMRGADSLARYGGDEFLVLLPSTGSEDAEIARARLAEILAKAGAAHIPRFSVSLGVFSSGDADFDELFRESDKDLYRRKVGPLAIGENLLAALDFEGKT
jgi:diguanylate cyclase (GGDEF)-like protein